MKTSSTEVILRKSGLACEQAKSGGKWSALFFPARFAVLYYTNLENKTWTSYILTKRKGRQEIPTAIFSHSILIVPNSVRVNKRFITVEALWADTLASDQLYLRPPWQNPVWTVAHTNSVLAHSRKRPAPVADTFSASQGCPLTGASTV